MRESRTYVKYLGLLVGLFLLASCGGGGKDESDLAGVGGGGIIPHDLPFADPSQHGSVAKSNLAFCQQCHGTPGSIQFGGGIASTSCAECHNDSGAHPTRWQGTNDTTPVYLSTHRTSGSRDTACAICHNVTADAPGPNPSAPSCFSANFTNADGSSTGCHASGPGTSAPHVIPFADPTLHGPVAKQDLAFCQQCHGTPGTTEFSGGIVSVSCAAAECHPAAGAHPTRWQGTNDITPAYQSSHRTSQNQNTTCVICHDFTQGRTPPNPSAPSCFSAGYTNADGSGTGCHASGPSAGHSLPFTDPALHGPQAKADLTFCQECHADPFDGGPGSNPRFDVPRGSLISGCESAGCHEVNTGHPVTPSVPFWVGPLRSHNTAGNLDGACTLCHGANLQGPGEGGVGPACEDCHTAGSPVNLVDCTSCHNDPPDSGPPAGDIRPNRIGSHSEHDALAKVTGICITCHDGFGTNAVDHFDGSEPADVSVLATYDARTGAAAYDSFTMTCTNASCHGGQQTPDWVTGAIDVDTDCASCHELGTAQFNSYNSGRHEKHVVDEGFDCTECHDTARLASGHFIGLDTPAFESDPALTMRIDVNFTPGNPPSCSPVCHGLESWD